MLCNCFILQDQYIELTSSIPSSATLFGLGEYTSNVGFPLRRDGIPYTLWNRDQPPAVPNANLYGSHPIILDIRDGESVGLVTCCLQGDVQQYRVIVSTRHQHTGVQGQYAGLRYKAEGSDDWQLHGVRGKSSAQGGCAMA